MSRSYEFSLSLAVLQCACDELRRIVQRASLPTVLVVGPDVGWLQRDDGPRVDLRRRRAARLILRRLLHERWRHPGAPLPLQELIAAGWPDERISQAAAANRAYVTLTRLRGLGLRGVLQHRDGGFLLDPAVPVRSAAER